MSCNPYDHHGVLLVNLTVAAENKWEPISAPPSCEVTDFLSLIWAARTEVPSPKIDFARNRTIAILGDSVDRDHNEHLCSFVGGSFEMIGENHELSPPYPKGQEIPEEGYKNNWTGERHWPDYHQSRPFVCHVEWLNLRILNVFHYGYKGADSWILNHPHYYPPALVEDRFEQILVPLVASLARKYNTSEVPDLVSVSSGMWDLLRLSVGDEVNWKKAVADGRSAADAELEFGAWNEMGRKERQWFEVRMMELLRRVAGAWREPAGGPQGAVKPTILWRTLHHIRAHAEIPFGRIQAVDQIGRSVVEQLQIEGKAAELGAKSWRAWWTATKATLGRTAGSGSESEALVGGLGSRLVVDEWGALMLGQERHFRDDMHPLPLPASFLYGNMLLQQLKMAVERAEGVSIV